jgi:hypothetical protein
MIVGRRRLAKMNFLLQKERPLCLRNQFVGSSDRVHRPETIMHPQFLVSLERSLFVSLRILGCQD